MALMHGTLKIRTANTSCDGFFDSVCKVMLETLMKFVRWSLKQGYSQYNHKNYNFLNCDWFKKILFPTNSLAKLLLDSLILILIFVQFCYHSYDYRPNWTSHSPITITYLLQLTQMCCPLVHFSCLKDSNS